MFLDPLRPQYYKVIEECVSQVVLHRNGMDPDFGYSQRLDVDFTHLIGTLLNFLILLLLLLTYLNTYKSFMSNKGKS